MDSIRIRLFSPLATLDGEKGFMLAGSRMCNHRWPIDHTLRVLAILAFVLFVDPIARAADDAGSFVAYGLGNKTCSEWIESRARNDTDSVRMAAWIQGFISAYNKYFHNGINVAGEMDDDEIFAAIDKHCMMRPFDSVSLATNALIERLSDADDSRGIGGLLDLFR